MIKILFLDVDGVLNDSEWLARNEPRESDSWAWMLDPEKCQRLDKVLARTGAKVCLSSSWRHGFSPKEFQRLLKPLCPSLSVTDSTPEIVPDAKCRGDEIQAWLSRHPWVEIFAIVDDMDDMGHLTHRLVRTSMRTGLLDKHVEALVTMLGVRDDVR